jgi:hypothetical protein
MKKNIHNLLIISFLTIIFSCQKPPQKSTEKFVPDFALNRFEKEIQTFEKADSAQGITKGQVLFYGSSSFRFWKTVQQDLAPLPIINHGFGGSTFPELTYYAKRMIFPYEPKTLVIYCENDMFFGKGKSPKQNFDDYLELVNLVRKELPKTKIYTLSLKPSPLRREKWEGVKKVNASIENFSKTHKRMSYIDITKVMYLPNGQINGSLFVKDSLHMNPDGYKLWTGVIKPILSKELH